MPVTARLSKQFYDRLGEAVANELVDWFNQVDSTYRTDLRDLNELNFARFDAKLEQRIAASEARIDQRIAASEARIDQRMAALEAKIDHGTIELAARFDVVESRTNARIEAGLREQTRFFFLAWALLLASNIALWFRP